MAVSDPRLAELADAVGIATEFWDWKGRLRDTSAETIRAVLWSMGIDARTPQACSQALEEVRNRRWRRRLPLCPVVEQGRCEPVMVHVPHGAWVKVTVFTEDGQRRELSQLTHDVPPRIIDGQLVGEAAFEVPGDLPVGYHRLQALTADDRQDSDLVISPAFLGFPASMGTQRSWGYAMQLYALTSTGSWGLGDLADLADFAEWSAKAQHAGFVLVNPLHAAEPITPIEDSPYLPSSRRFTNPIYLRPEAIPEYADLPATARTQVQKLKRSLLAAIQSSTLIDRDPIWEAKFAALRIIFEAGRSTTRQHAFEQYRQREGHALDQFATWSALASQYGRDFRQWPGELADAASDEVAAFAEAHPDLISYFAWLQWEASNQLRAAQDTARGVGMPIGIMNDLAVGVSASSAEAWFAPELFATQMDVGAPPDHFNQSGQGWGQSPWRPDRLEELSYAPFRELVSGLCRSSGGLRIDHVMGLFRLWWVPEGQPPDQGTYVRYPHQALVGILLLEAQRAGALVVGEDLGVVEPWVRDYLRTRGILGTSVAWFEVDDQGRPLPAESWPEYSLASVTTHDLPPTVGYLAGDHITLRNELGLLTEPFDSEFAEAMRYSEQMIAGLIEAGYLDADHDGEDVVLALHRLLRATGSRVLCAALTDAVGQRPTQNQPGTSTEYPNWRIPLSGPAGERLTLDDVKRNARCQRLADVMNGDR